ncbi:MAG: hypothetical protein II684_01210 [Treponema sp.]|nr:hypothetical protein [Treponema sp.]
MKKTKFISGIFALGLAFSLVMTGCSNDDDDNSSGSEASEAAMELDAAAFNLLRGLCSLPTDAINTEEAGDGIEDLPDGWQTRTYELDQALIPAPSAEGEGVYYISATCADEAKEFFSSLIADEVSENSHSWSMAGLGSLKFEVSPTAEDAGTKLFATIEVSISLLPQVQTIKFVPHTVLPSGTNKFAGTSYYSVGDIIKRNKDNTLWMCVRPSSGPAKKDYSYWICLNPSETLIKTDRKTISNNGNKQYFYAKKLMSEKIAKATIHTLHMLTIGGWTGSGNGKDAMQQLYDKGIDLRRLVSTNVKKLPTYFPEEGELFSWWQLDAKINKSFYVAYGSSKKDTKRIVKGSSKNAEFNLVQPFLAGSFFFAGSQKQQLKEDINTNLLATDTTKALKTYYSLTDSYDATYLNANSKDFSNAVVIDEVFDARNGRQTCEQDGTNIGWRNSGVYAWLYNQKQRTGYNVIISPELKLKDNSNRPATGYTEVFHNTQAPLPDYWGSLKSENTYRRINGKTVDMSKQISE